MQGWWSYLLLWSHQFSCSGWKATPLKLMPSTGHQLRCSLSHQYLPIKRVISSLSLPLWQANWKPIMATIIVISFKQNPQYLLHMSYRAPFREYYKHCFIFSVGFLSLSKHSLEVVVCFIFDKNKAKLCLCHCHKVSAQDVFIFGSSFYLKKKGIIIDLMCRVLLLKF